MKTFEVEVRDMLRRRAGDVSPTPQPWQQLEAADLQPARPLGAAGPTRRLVAVAAVAAIVLGAVALQVVRTEDASPPPPIETPVPQPPPFDPDTTSAIWPVGRDGTPSSWFRTAAAEPQQVTPAPSDDAAAVARAYLQDRFGATRVVLDDTARHAPGTAVHRWRVSTGSHDATGSVYLRRVVLPNSFERHAWVVVGASSDHLRVTFPKAPGGQVAFELARHDAPFASSARVELPTGTSVVELGAPRTFSVAFDQPVVFRAQLLGDAALTLVLTEFRVDPQKTPFGGKPLANIRGVLALVPGLGLTDAAANYLMGNFDVGPDDLVVEPEGGGSLNVRYRSPKIGTGVVRMDRTDTGSVVVAVVGDGLTIEGMTTKDEERVFALSSELPGRVSAVLRNEAQVLGQGSTLLPGIEMFAGLEVAMTAELPPDTAPVAQFRVEGPWGTTVAAYCLPG